MAITPRAAGAWAASNATTQTVTLPTHAAGDMLIVIAACKPFSANPTVGTSGWARLFTTVDGSVGNGNGVGSVRQAVFYKEAASAAETNPVVDWNTTSAPGIAVAHSYEKGATDVWDTPLFQNGNTNASTSISVALANPGIAAGDVVIVTHTTRDDSALTVPTWTQSGATLAAVVEFPATAIATATSNDMAGDAAYRIVTAPGSGNITATGTQGAAETGVTSIIVLRAYVPVDAFVDNFNRSVTDGAGTSSDGNVKWIVDPIDGEADVDVDGAKLVLAGSDAQGRLVRAIEYARENGRIRCRIGFPAINIGGQAYIQGRRVGFSYYYAVLTGANPYNVQLWKVVAGETQIGSGVSTGITAVNDKMLYVEFQYDGTALRIGVGESDWPSSWLIDTTDSAISGAGTMSLRATSATAYFDDLDAGAIPAAAERGPHYRAPRFVNQAVPRASSW